MVAALAVPLILREADLVRVDQPRDSFYPEITRFLQIE
jgi:hypothetical protein